MKLYYTIYACVMLLELLVCSVIGSVLVRRRWPLPCKLLLGMVWVTFCVESLSTWFMYSGVNNSMIYYLWMPVETFTTVYVMTRALTRRTLRLIPWYFVISLSILLPLFFRSAAMESTTSSYYLIYFLFVNLLVSCVVLVELFRSPAEPVFSREPVFWLATGMLFYSSIFLVILSAGHWTSRIGYNLYLQIYIPFSVAANLCMYGGFSIYFIKYSRLHNNLNPRV